MKRHFKRLVMAAACMAVALCVSCKKEVGNEAMGSGVGIFGDISGIIDGHEYVDLGLTSGTLWASCNVGAESPEDYGDYYAWGETEPKSTYDWLTYKWCQTSQNNLTKYNTNLIYGNVVDDKTVLDSVDDAAHANWGGGWRMPTEKEMKELKEECHWSKFGREGCFIVTGPNEKSILIPLAGYKSGDVIKDRGARGFYWSSSLYSPKPYSAYALHFFSASVNPTIYYSRSRGYTVRPVCDPE